MKRRLAPRMTTGTAPAELFDHRSTVWHDVVAYRAWCSKHLGSEPPPNQVETWPLRFNHAAYEWAVLNGYGNTHWPHLADHERLTAIGVNPVLARERFCSAPGL